MKNEKASVLLFSERKIVISRCKLYYFYRKFVQKYFNGKRRTF